MILLVCGLIYGVPALISEVVGCGLLRFKMSHKYHIATHRIHFARSKGIKTRFGPGPGLGRESSLHFLFFLRCFSASRSVLTVPPLLCFYKLSTV